MATSIQDFAVEGIKATCCAVVVNAKRYIANRQISFVSRKDSCRRGQIAGLASHMVIKNVPYSDDLPVRLESVAGNLADNIIAMLEDGTGFQ